ncbi:MAG: kinase [Ruminococcus sp.]|jgi:hypothetical protein
MRLQRIRDLLEEMNLKYTYTEVDGCGSLDFDYRGVPYHIWEFHDGEWGAETNVQNGGQSEDILGDYEGKIISIIKNWK